MDSLTQIVLGAGVGEIVLGKKLGNRAFLWGGIAGTIPDLDVLGNAFMSEIESLAFHRGVSHSFFFAITFSFIIAYLVFKFYNSGFYQKKFVRLSIAFLTGMILLLIGAFISSVISQAFGVTGIVISILLFLSLYFPLSYLWKYTRKDRLPTFSISYKEWYWFFFWTIITHPILDSFTAYGTQLFAPFSDYRVAFNNISVADPLYTLPFLLCLILAFRYPHSNSKRRILAWLGIIVSSLYLIFTFYNKYRIDRIMVDTLESNNIPYTRFTTSPSILNNILWSGTAEVGDTFYLGNYSFFDQERTFKLEPIPKNAEIINNQINDPVIKQLRWFANDYYNFSNKKGEKIQFNDLRYGKFIGQDSYIFRFIIEKNENGYELIESLAGPDNADRKNVIGDVFQRMKGI